jgi:2-keto-3-deoxy-L-rhamnonate aldolase RhmA
MTVDLAPHRIPQVILERLKAGQMVTALGVRFSRNAEIARFARSTGHDALWIDLEHSTMSVDTAAAIGATASDLGLLSMVRVPERDYGVIGRLLDGGVHAIISPRVETAEQAMDIVAACKFPPLGHRSAIATLSMLGYRKTPAMELAATMNQSTLVKVLIESPLGIRNIADIAAVAGVDLLGIGTNDLMAEMGLPGDYRHPLVREAHEKSIASCRAQGKLLMVGGIGDLGYVAELLKLGAAPLVYTGIDGDLLLGAVEGRIRDVLQIGCH